MNLCVRRCALAVLVLSLLGGCANTHRAAVPVPTGMQAATLRTRHTEPAGDAPSEGMISLDVQAHTRHHKPVADLLASELRVTDNGDPVELASVRRVVGTDEGDHLLAFVFDRLRPGSAHAGRAAAEKILAEVPSPGYKVAVLAITGHLHVLVPYTGELSNVVSGVEQATPKDGLVPASLSDAPEATLVNDSRGEVLGAGAGERAAAKALVAALGASERKVADRRNAPGLASLEALVESERLLPGRKFVVYVTGGVPPGAEAQERLRSVVSLANSAGVVLCIVDTSMSTVPMGEAMQNRQIAGLLATGINGDSLTSFGAAPPPRQGGVARGGQASSPTNSGGVPGASSGAAAAMQSSMAHDMGKVELGVPVGAQSPLKAMAAGTGGVYLNVHDGYAPELEQMREDLSSWYQVTWKFPGSSYNGQFRPVHVFTTRKSVQLRARSGYFATEPQGRASVQPFEEPLLRELNTGALSPDVPFHLGVLHLGGSPQAAGAELVVQVPWASLEAREDARTHLSTLHATVEAVLKDSQGKVLEHFGEDFPVHQAAGANGGGVVTLQRQFGAEPGTYSVEVAVCDRLSGKTGVQHDTFTLLPEPMHGPSLGELTLVSKVEPMDGENEGFEPMRFEGGRVVPRLGDEPLTSADGPISLFVLLHPLGANESPRPTLAAQIVRNGKLVKEVPMQLDAVESPGVGVPYLATFGAPLPPGNYQVRAQLTQGVQSVTSAVSFVVEGGKSTDETTAGAAEAGFPDSGWQLTRPAVAVPAPGAEEQQTILKGAREQALSWSGSLRNFLCMEATEHLVDSGTDGWQHKDSMVEHMRYVDHQLERTMVSLNGKPTSVEPDSVDFMHSSGEFGAMFHVVFDPDAQATFTWKEAGFVEGRPVQVFTFSVDRAHSGYSLSDRQGHAAVVAFHGEVFIDPATDAVRRISLVADEIPPQLAIRECSVAVDYSWVPMQDSFFLLPVRGAVHLQEPRHRAVLNEFEFSDYHRFGSKVRLTSAQD